MISAMLFDLLGLDLDRLRRHAAQVLCASPGQDIDLTSFNAEPVHACIGKLSLPGTGPGQSNGVEINHVKHTKTLFKQHASS
jgi:hypothetical protein